MIKVFSFINSSANELPMLHTVYLGLGSNLEIDVQL